MAGVGLGAGLCGQEGTTGMRAKPEPVLPCRVRQWGPLVAPASPRLAMTCRCWSCPLLCWAASWSCTNIIWSPTRSARVSGERPDKKSLTWGEKEHRQGTARHGAQRPPPSNSTSPCSGATALRSHGCSAGSRGVTPSSPWPHRAGGEQPRPRTTPAQCQLHQLTAPSLLPPPPPSSPSTKLPRCARPPRHRTHSTRRQGRAGADTAV